MMKNRCGAKGVLECVGNNLFFVINELITSVEYEGGLKLALEEDLSVGQSIPLEVLANEHRGLSVFDRSGTCIDEGEVRIKTSSGEKLFFFISDYNSDYNGVLSRLSVAILKEYELKIKPEIYDQVGAFGRLKQIKKAFRL